MRSKDCDSDHKKKKKPVSRIKIILSSKLLRERNILRSKFREELKKKNENERIEMNNTDVSAGFCIDYSKDYIGGGARRGKLGIWPGSCLGIAFKSSS